MLAVSGGLTLGLRHRMRCWFVAKRCGTDVYRQRGEALYAHRSVVSDFSDSVRGMMKRMMIIIVALFAFALTGCGASPADRAEKIQAALDENFSCNWEQDKGDVTVYRCDGDGLILMTGDDDAVENFVNAMMRSGIGGSAVVGSGYVVLTETHTPAEEVKETLGDDKADVIEIGDGGGSGFNPGGGGPTSAPSY